MAQLKPHASLPLRGEDSSPDAASASSAGHPATRLLAKHHSQTALIRRSSSYLALLCQTKWW